MKSAICISGHLRNWKENKSTIDFIKYISSISEKCNVFVSTWNRENAVKSWSQMHGLSNLARCNNLVQFEDISNFYMTDSIHIADDDFYSSEFSPLRYSNLTSKIFNWNINGQQNGILHSTRMYYMIFIANMLKQIKEFESNESYDLVFRVRPDFEFFEDKYKNFDFQNIKKDVLYIRKPPGSNICDQFAFGSSEIMNQYSSTFLKIGGILSEGIFGDPEEFLFRNLSSLNMKVSLLNNLDELFGFGCLGSEIVKDFKR